MKTLCFFLFLFGLALAQDLTSNIANAVAEKSNELSNSVVENIQNIVADASETASETLTGVLDDSNAQIQSVIARTLPPGLSWKPVNNSTSTKKDELTEATSNVIKSIANKEAVINAIKGFNNGKSTSIKAKSSQSDAGRAEISNYIINSLNKESMNIRELIDFAGSKLDPEEAGEYLTAMAQQLSDAGF